MEKQVWIGLFGSVIDDGNLYFSDCNYAYVIACAKADNDADFISMVTSALKELRFSVEEVDDVSLFSERIANHEVESETRALAESAKSTDQVLLGTFHVAE